ncbi:MAG: hypothetical protein Q7S77_01350 [Candidatus Staskawiczbacteria bacterium]|nr:hypothetical protein [Candidatus Staskawiczbacteria bacterium]
MATQLNQIGTSHPPITAGHPRITRRMCKTAMIKKIIVVVKKYFFWFIILY